VPAEDDGLRAIMQLRQQGDFERVAHPGGTAGAQAG
jgi:hypothetical protein